MDEAENENFTESSVNLAVHPVDGTDHWEALSDLERLKEQDAFVLRMGDLVVRARAERNAFFLGIGDLAVRALKVLLMGAAAVAGGIGAWKAFHPPDPVRIAGSPAATKPRPEKEKPHPRTAVPKDPQQVAPLLPLDPVRKQAVPSVPGIPAAHPSPLQLTVEIRTLPDGRKVYVFKLQFGAGASHDSDRRPHNPHRPAAAIQPYGSDEGKPSSEPANQPSPESGTPPMTATGGVAAPPPEPSTPAVRGDVASNPSTGGTSPPPDNVAAEGDEMATAP